MGGVVAGLAWPQQIGQLPATTAFPATAAAAATTNSTDTATTPATPPPDPADALQPPPDQNPPADPQPPPQPQQIRMNAQGEGGSCLCIQLTDTIHILALDEFNVLEKLKSNSSSSKHLSSKHRKLSSFH